MEDHGMSQPSGRLKTLSLLALLLGIGIWVIPGSLYWLQGSLTVARLLALGFAGSVCWFIAGSLIAQPSAGTRKPAVVICLLALAIWAIPATLLCGGELLAVRAHLMIWAVLYLAGLVCVLIGWFGRRRHR